MKNILGMIILVFWGSSVMMAQKYHYYYKGEVKPLELNTAYAYLVVEGQQDLKGITELIEDAEVTRWGIHRPQQTLDNITGVPLFRLSAVWAEIKFPRALENNRYQARLENLRKKANVRVVSPYFKNDREEKIGLSDLVTVKLNHADELGPLQQLASDMGAVIVGRNRFMPEWITLAVTNNSRGTALEVANAMWESGLLAASEPDLMVDVAHCVNDTYFGNQWGHEHSGQNGWSPQVDIHACDGWSNWGTGSNSTIVAVLDHGFEQNHPDLMANNIGTGFDSESGTTPAQVLGSHGTACAGIVGAVSDNNLGVAGVAPDIGLMSISNSLAGTPNSRQKRADGINWAVANGAAVSSNSWGSGVQYAVIDDAITDAIANGRGGLGTVICFSAGNGNGSVSYPANSNPDIIAVGAMSPCAERKNPASCDGEGWWGSDYGTELDVMAPGVKVPTTDRQGGNGYDASDYTQTFNGTSSACPHVAGLAGLLIDLNPCLTAAQVANIIESTAQKVGTYTYSTTAGRPNGTWNNEMGYGLIDIDAAMQMTRELYLQDETVSDTRTYQVHGSIFAGENVDPSQPVGDFTVASGGDVTLAATVGITLDAGFNVNLGATFTAEIITTNCSDWDETARRAQPVVAEADEVEGDEAPEDATIEFSDQATFTTAPNPFRERLVLSYRLPQSAEVSVRLYTLHGQMVGDLVPAGRHDKGVFTKDFDTSAFLTEGMYILRIEVDGVVTTRRLVKH